MKFFTKRVALLAVLLLVVAGVKAQFEINGIKYMHATNGDGVAVVEIFRTGHVDIPEKVHYAGTDLPVTEIGQYSSDGNTGIKSVTIPSSVTKIGGCAFAGCTGLTSISIPSSVTTIEWTAFADCSSLSSIHIPSSVTHIGSFAFSRCSSLTSIHIPASVVNIGEEAFSGCSSLTSINVEEGNTAYSSIGGMLLNKEGTKVITACKDLETVTIPASVDSIGDYAFQDCSKLAFVTIPSSVTYIGVYAFASCSSLTSVRIPSSVRKIIGNTFKECDNLTSIYIPSSVSSVAENAFEGCDKLSAINIAQDNVWLSSAGRLVLDKAGTWLYAVAGDSSVTIPAFVTHFRTDTKLLERFDSIHVEKGNTVYSSVDGMLLDKDGTTLIIVPNNHTSVTIPSSVRVIGERAFEDCTHLSHVSLPSGLTEIGEYAFTSCDSLASVSLPSSVTEIGEGAFVFCTSLSSISIPSSVTRIRAHTFRNCSGLASVSIPSTVTSIENQAFAQCSSLTSIEIPSSVTAIDMMAFEGCTGLVSVTIPVSVTSIGTNAFNECSSLAEINVDEQNKMYSSVRGMLLNKYQTELIKVPNVAESVTVPYTVKRICGNAFNGCANLVSVNLPYNLQRIEGAAFKGCGKLASINIPSSVTFIGSGAFQDCTSLATVVLPQKLSSVEINTFKGCSNLESVVVRPSVSRIESYAFANCPRLDSLVIPAEVIFLDATAFTGCTSLEHVVLLSQHPNCLRNFRQTLKDNYFNGTTMVYSTDSIFKQLPELWNAREDLLFEAEPDGNWFTRLDFSLRNFSPVMELMYVNGTDGEMLSSDENGKYTLEGLKPGQAYTLSVYAMIMGASYPIQLNMRTADFSVKMSDLGPTAVSCQVDYPEGAIVDCVGFEGHDTESGILQWTGLEPEAEYALRYYVTNEKDGTITKDTLFQTPALAFSTLPAKATSNTVALICAETNLSDMETGAGFEWRRYDAPDLVPSTKSPCPVVDGVLTGALRNLSSNTYYKFRPYYTSASGQTYYGDWLAFGTADAYVYFDPTVRTYEATGVTATAASVRGYAIAGSDDITEQGFEYWPEEAVPRRSASAAKRVQAEGQFMTAKLEDLQPGTTYKFRVYVETAKGTTYGDEQEFTTMDDGSTGISGIENDDEAEGFSVAVRGSLADGSASVRVQGGGAEARWMLVGLGGTVAAGGQVVADGNWQALDAPALPRGIYLLTVRAGEAVKTMKLLAR